MSPAEWFTPQCGTWKGSFILHSQNLPSPQSLWTPIKPFITVPRNLFHFYNSGMLYAPRSTPNSASLDPVLSLRCCKQMIYWLQSQTMLIFLFLTLFFFYACVNGCFPRLMCVTCQRSPISLSPSHPQFRHPSMRLKATVLEWAVYLCYVAKPLPCPRQRTSGSKVKKGESWLTV